MTESDIKWLRYIAAKLGEHHETADWGRAVLKAAAALEAQGEPVAWIVKDLGGNEWLSWRNLIARDCQPLYAAAQGKLAAETPETVLRSEDQPAPAATPTQRVLRADESSGQAPMRRENAVSGTADLLRGPDAAGPVWTEEMLAENERNAEMISTKMRPLPMASETPETDEHELFVDTKLWEKFPVVPADFARKLERERNAARAKHEDQLIVGPYTITPTDKGFWIGHESGEGMACKAADFEAVIWQFWKENF